jgi:DNA (cytosine-5)-methyltransferase 1
VYVPALDGFSEFRALDGFCGAGGSSIGLSYYFWVVWAANHDRKTVAVHEVNHPRTDHETADLSNYKWRSLPRRIHLAWFSPSCTHHSPAGGRRRPRRAEQLDLFTDQQEDDRPLDDGTAERSRMTMLDVVAATEVHMFPYVIVENVIEATEWRLFDWLLQGMINLGYQYRPLCVSSAHVWNGDEPGVPQFRDRWYGIFVRNGLPVPDLEPYPLAWCPVCEQDVRTLQSWRNPTGRKIGKYNQAIPWREGYDYRCPNTACRHAVVSPYVRPMFSAIDWSDPGELMGPRLHTYRPNTLFKVQDGLDRLGRKPMAITVTHGLQAMDRTRYVDEASFPTRTTKIGDALVIPDRAEAVRTMQIAAEPFVAILRKNGPTYGVTAGPFRTVATARHHALVIPPVVGKRPDGVPVVRPDEIGHCRFRMTTWRESLNAQGFPVDYNMLIDDPQWDIGVTNATAMAGNAVSTNVARWLAGIFAEQLGRMGGSSGFITAGATA